MMKSKKWAGCLLILGVQLVIASPNVENETEFKDRRFGRLKDLNGHFPFEVPSSRDEWESRSQTLQKRLLISQGLLPFPRKMPLNPIIHGRINLGDYSVEKVYFESFPGFFVTGNLYRPIGRKGLLPGVLCPHGHWSEGRFMDNKKVREEIISGAERFENGGRSPLQSRCVQLARMGSVVFHYDMIGYADSIQIPFEIAHGFSKQRAEMNREKGWGLFSPQAESHLQSVMGLQTWNSIRSLDFLESLPEVDPNRLAITGASGGGTQTFILTAIDQRLAVAFPAVMVSTKMQGGCPCENASLLRIETGNVELAALFAPKPLGLSGANDWTKEMSSKGFPELQMLYRMFGKEDHVRLFAFNHFGHNYNYVSRSAMYHWFNHHLQLGLDEPIVEGDFARLSREDLKVWNHAHPQPKGGDEFERKLLTHWHKDGVSQLSEAAKSRSSFVEIVAPALKIIIGRSLESAGEVEWKIKEKYDRGDHFEMTGWLFNRQYEEVIPIVFFHPKEWAGEVIIWLHHDGKKGLKKDLYEAGKLTESARQLLSKGITIIGTDLLYQGESFSDERQFEQFKNLKKTRSVSNPREVAAYTFGYNHSLFAHRVHDVLSIVRFLKTHDEAPKSIGMIALKGAGHWGAVARSLLGKSVADYAIDTGGFRFGKIEKIHDPDFLPGGAKYLDLKGFLLAGETQSLWLKGENDDVRQSLRRAYFEEGRGDELYEIDESEIGKISAVDWFLR